MFSQIIYCKIDELPEYIPRFPPSPFYYYRFSLGTEFKMQLRGQGVCCKLWLNQHSNLLKPLEMAIFFVCDKWQYYVVVILSGTNIIRDNIITSNIQDNPIPKFHIYAPTIFLLANFLFVNRKWFRRKKSNNYM